MSDSSWDCDEFDDEDDELLMQMNLSKRSTTTTTSSSSSTTTAAPSALRCNESRNSSYSTRTASCDAITGETLESDHVEWLSPDKELKICYNVSTLFKCAKNTQFGVQLRQPPHFRGPMSPEMKQEIQERFPNAYQSFVTSANQQRSDMAEHDADFAAFIQQEIADDGAAAIAFWGDAAISQRVAEQENLQEYYQNLPLKGELRVCPLCYGYLTQTFLDDDDEEEQVEEVEDFSLVTSIDATRDPIRLLTKCAGANVEGVQGCSYFLATTMKSMKKHLKEAHNIPIKKLTRKSGCAGLLNKCQIRAADGLVQRYWHTKQKKEGGHKARYW